MATIVEPADATSPHDTTPALSNTLALVAWEQVFLNEERARVALKRSPPDVDAAWCLDTGASNHMTGDDSFFSDLDKSVTRKVRFGDGSLIDICGHGMVLFAINNKRDRELSNVY